MRVASGLIIETGKLLIRASCLCALFLVALQPGVAQDEVDNATVSAVGPLWRAVDARRKVVNSRLNPATLDLENAGRPLSDFQRLSNSNRERPQRLIPSWPVRVFTLWTGESFVAQLIGSRDPESLEILFGADRLPVKRSLIRKIELPVGIREVLFVPQEPDAHGGWMSGLKETPFTRSAYSTRTLRQPRDDQYVPANFATMRFDPRIANGDITIRLRWPFKPQSRRSASPRRLYPTTSPNQKPDPLFLPTQELQFAFADFGQSDSVARVLSIKNSAAGIIEVHSPNDRHMTTHKVRIENANLSLRLAFGSQTILSINGTVAARSSKPLGELLFMRIDGRKSSGITGIGFTSVWERLPASKRIQFSRTILSDSSDRVLLRDGSELFGSLHTQTPAYVEIESNGSKITVESNLVQSVETRRPKDLTIPTITGNLAAINLRSIPGVATRKVSQLIVALQSANATHLKAHSLIGTIHIPWRDIQHIEPLGDCTYQILRAVPLHLGTATRADFESVQPDGTHIEFKFILGQALQKPAKLSVLAAEIEPSGPETLSARPRLRELRAGHFTTEVWVNDKFAGTLNGYLSHLWKADEPQRIDLAILPQDLLVGMNRIVLKQKPSLDNADLYDDCEIKTVALKFAR
jgi:hypothetical protein